MEALYVIVPIIGLIVWLSVASLRHERKRLNDFNERVRTQVNPEQRFREAFDDPLKEW